MNLAMPRSGVKENASPGGRHSWRQEEGLVAKVSQAQAQKAGDLGKEQAVYG